MSNSIRPTVFLAFLGIVVIGGTNFVAVRFSNLELSPFWGAGLRFGFASLILFVIARIKKLKLPKGRALLGDIVYGILAIGISYAFLYTALVQVTAGFASVITSLLPLMTIFLAYAHGLEKITARTLLGSLITVVGIILLFNDQLSVNAQFVYILAMLGATFTAAESAIVIKKFPKNHMLTTNAIGMGTGALMLFILAIISKETMTIPSNPSTIIALFYLIIFGSIGLFSLYLFVLSKWSASATSYALVLMPIVATLVSAWLEKTSITIVFVLSCAIVIFGVYLGAISQTSKRSKS